MVSLDDPQGFNETFSNERSSLRRLADEGAIEQGDYEAIDRFIKTHDGVKTSTKAEYLKRIRLTAKRTDVPLTEMTEADLRDVLFAYEHGEHPDVKDGGFADGTLRNYRKALRIFFEFLDRDWADDIHVGSPVKNRVSEDDILSPDDIEAMRRAATRTRDAALVEFMADTAVRLSMVCSLRIADVSLDDDRPSYTPNPNATGLKNAPQQPYPIIDSKAVLRTYLRDAHPQPENSSAALFHKLRGYSLDDGDDGALSPVQLNRRLKQLAETAGIDKPVNPHNFRRSAITRMYREGFTKQEIQHRVAWTLDTDMWKRYVHLTAEQMNEQIFAEAGVVEETDAVSKERQTCGNCREIVPPHADYCGNCGEPVSPEARDLTMEAEDSVVSEMVETADAGERRLLQKVRELIREDPSLLDAPGD